MISVVAITLFNIITTTHAIGWGDYPLQPHHASRHFKHRPFGKISRAPCEELQVFKKWEILKNRTKLPPLQDFRVRHPCSDELREKLWKDAEEAAQRTAKVLIEAGEPERAENYKGYAKDYAYKAANLEDIFQKMTVNEIIKKEQLNQRYYMMQVTPGAGPTSGNYADKPGVWLYDELLCTLKKGGLHRVCRRGAISKRHKQSNMVALPKAIILNVPASALAALFVFSVFTFALRRICKPASATAKEALLAVN